MNPPDLTAAIVQSLLMYVLLPTWLLAGLGDWLCHRVQRIEETTGLKESLMHLLLLAEMGIGVCAVLLLEIDAAVLVLLIVCCVAHEVTTWWDLSYAMTLRRIPVVEQWVHSLQMVLPWTGLISLMVLHHEQTLALIGWVHRRPTGNGTGRSRRCPLNTSQAPSSARSCWCGCPSRRRPGAAFGCDADLVPRTGVEPVCRHSASGGF